MEGRVVMGRFWCRKIYIHLLFKIPLTAAHICTFAWNFTRGLLHALYSPPWIARYLLQISTSGFQWPPELWVSKVLTYGLRGHISKSLYLGLVFFFFNGFLLVFLVYTTDKSSLSSLDCLSSIVDRITNSEQPGLPLQDPASLSPVASMDSQPATPGPSNSRLIYHVLWTENLV